VAVGIAEVHRPQRAARAGLRNGAELDGDAFASQMSDDVVERNVRAEADIDRSRRRDARVRLELAAGLMEVELPFSEGEGAPALREGDSAHPQCSFVKGDGAIDVADLARERVLHPLTLGEKTAEEPPLRGAEAVPREEHATLRIDANPDDADEEAVVRGGQESPLPPNGERVEDDRERAHEHRETL